MYLEGRPKSGAEIEQEKLAFLMQGGRDVLSGARVFGDVLEDDLAKKLAEREAAGITDNDDLRELIRALPAAEARNCLVVAEANLERGNIDIALEWADRAQKRTYEGASKGFIRDAERDALVAQASAIKEKGQLLGS